MTNDEINKYIATEIMSIPCYHEAENEEYATVRCRHCGSSFGGGAWRTANPDYCSDDSPRGLLTVPIMVVIAHVGRLKFAEHVLAIAHPDCEFEYGLMQLLLEVGAQYLATACVEAHQAK